MACRWLCGGFGQLCPASQGSKFGVNHKPSEYNSTSAPPSGRSGGTLDIPWTCPGTIEPPQPTVFDQPSLSRPLSCGISAAERFGCGASLWSAGARSLRLCGPCSAKLDLWAALPRISAFTGWRTGPRAAEGLRLDLGRTRREAQGCHSPPKPGPPPPIMGGGPPRPPRPPRNPRPP